MMLPNQGVIYHQGVIQVFLKIFLKVIAIPPIAYLW